MHNIGVHELAIAIATSNKTTLVKSVAIQKASCQDLLITIYLNKDTNSLVTSKSRQEG